MAYSCYHLNIAGEHGRAMSKGRNYKPWGYEEVLVNNDRYVVKRIFVERKHRLSLQAHKVKMETMMIYGGKGTVTLADKKIGYDIRSIREVPTIFDIPAGMVHRIEAAKDTVVYEVSTPELDDVTRFEDDYGRANG